MAAPNITKARVARDEAIHEAVRRVSVLREQFAQDHGNGGGTCLSAENAVTLENAVDDLKSALVHLANARSAVSFLEED